RHLRRVTRRGLHDRAAGRQRPPSHGPLRPTDPARPAGLYRALWTREILAEVVATVLRRRPDLSVELLRKRTAAMQAAPQDATVEGYEALVPGLQGLGADAHVVAAAVFGQADIILTSNIRDFPERVLDP